jgi:nitrite reductase/ring-hydroxylating ferredoxin subunit
MNSTVPASGFKVGALEEIPDGGGRIFQFPTAQGELCLLVLRSDDCCYGYINRCPHFGVPLATCDSQLLYESNHWIKCNVHYARFRWMDGFCEAGECAGESLQRVPLEVRNGKVLVAEYP